MQETIKNEYPPHYDILKLVFNPPKDAIITVNGIIYNPSGNPIDPDILEHEKVHIRQQKDNPDWFIRYLTDAKFREKVEIEAYSRQYQYLKEEIKLKNKELKIFLWDMAHALSKDYKLTITHNEAESKIRNYYR
jgi:hypothetical protein